MICRFQRFVWRRLACTNRFRPTLADRLWPDRLSHSLFGQLVWQMGRAGDGRGGRERGRGSGGHGVGVQWGRSRWEAVLEKVTRSQVGAVPSGEGAPAGTGPGGERSLVVANISRFFVVSRPSFHMFPISCGFFAELCWCFGRFHLKRP